jgi:hypothetical protein
MPTHLSATLLPRLAVGWSTILDKYIQAFLHQQTCIKNDKAEAERHNIVAGPNFQESPDCPLLSRSACNMP